MDPLTMYGLIQAIGSGIGAMGSASASGNMNDKQIALQRELQARQLAASAEADRQRIGLAEEGMDPYRQQRQQGSALAGLDLLAGSSYKKPTVTGNARYGQNKPVTTGGFSYDRDPALSGYGAQLRDSVASGRTAPTMYGRTAALNLSWPGHPAGWQKPVDTGGGVGAPPAGGGSGVGTPAGVFPGDEPPAGWAPPMGLTDARPYGDYHSYDDYDQAKFGTRAA